MIPKTFTQEIRLEDGRTITLETGKLAKQADGSVVVRMGNCMLLATIVSARTASPVDFLPLTVDYREKFAAAGRFPGGFFKREARPSDQEVLTMRLVDRVLRPLFPSDYHAETQVMIQLMSHDDQVMPDALAGLAASTVIQLSDIPFEYPISEVRVARVDGMFVINPSKEQLAGSDIDIMIGASEDSVAMVEGEFDEISEEEMLDAIAFGHEAIKDQIRAQIALAEAAGKKETRTYEEEDADAELQKEVIEATYQSFYDIAKKALSKGERSEQFSEIKENYISKFSEEELEEKGELISRYTKESQKKAVRDLVLNEGTRLDGRKTTDIRPIWCEVDYLPSAHGSSIFTRGETQALATVTLGTSREANIIDLPTEQGEERFYLHYNFPPFSTGEARPLRGTSRREVGHGNLAQRALKKVVPADSPYTIRVVSEVLESNGSSSMATVCAGTMALMDAGVQIHKPVSGIAMGLITEGEKFAVLSDILGDEDHLGDMDFKVAGTDNGITALQMDIKITGITTEIMQVALSQAREGIDHILKIMKKSLKGSREKLSKFAPQILTLKIHTDKIRDVIGKGGAVIKGLAADTGATIDIDDNGLIKIACTSAESGEEALRRIKEITADVEVDQIYDGKVIKILDFGAIVSLLPGKDGLLHISQISHERIKAVKDHLSEGDEVKVKVIEVDDKGRVRVSSKALTEPPAKEE